MLTADERLVLIRAKVERAKEHIANLESAVRAFLDSHPYVIETKLDPKIPNTERYYIKSVSDTPTKIHLVAGDVLFNLRAALDHLAYQLACANGTTDPRVLRQTYFPISDDAAKYKAEAPGKVKGMSAGAKKAIDTIKPYQGGNDVLWQLHRLNIIDKHRVLLTAGMAIAQHSLPRRLRRVVIDAVRAQQELPPEWERAIAEQGGRVEDVEIAVTPIKRKCPLKTGDELALAWEPSVAYVNEKVEFTFEVAINEVEVIEREPLVPTLVGMADRIDDLICNFKPLLV